MPTATAFTPNTPSRRERDLEAQSKQDYDKLVEKDTTITEQEALIRKLQKQLRDEQDEGRNYRQDLDAANAEIRKLNEKQREHARELATAEKKVEHANKETESTQKHYESLQKEYNDQIKFVTQVNNRLATAQANVTALHQQVDALEDEKNEAAKAASGQADLKYQLEEINTQFEDIFFDLGHNLTVDDYMKHVREQQTQLLRRQTSETSFKRGVSLGDELGGEMDSNADGENDLTEINVNAASAPVVLSFSPIQSVEIVPGRAETLPVWPKAILFWLGMVLAWIFLSGPLLLRLETSMSNALLG